MSLSGVPPLLRQLAGRAQQPMPPANMAQNEEEDEDQQMSDSDDMPYIKCEAVYGEDGDDDDDEMSALPFVRTEMREDEDEEEDHKMKFGMKAPEVGAYVKCSVPSCHSYFEVGNPKYEGFSHFKFPDDPVLRRRWIGIIGQKEDWSPEGAMICSNHFPEGSFVNVVECILATGQLMTKRTLKQGALPTVNLELPPSWNMQRIVLPPNNGVQAATPVPPAAQTQRPVIPAAVPPPTPIRSPYCQGRAITLTKNGKRRGRPPKNRPPDDYSPNVSVSVAQLLNSGTTVTNVASKVDPPLSMTTTSASNGVSKTTMTSTSTAPQGNSFPLTRPLPPFQLLGMGKRKRGRPRKDQDSILARPQLPSANQQAERAVSYEDECEPDCRVTNREIVLRRLAESAVERNTWRARGLVTKRRRLLPAPDKSHIPAPDRPRRIVQLQCNVDPINYLMNQEGENDKRSTVEADISYFNSLVSKVTDLSAASLAELRAVVEKALVRLRKVDEMAKAKKTELENVRRNEEEDAAMKRVCELVDIKREPEAKEKKVDMDVKIPPSVSIKAVGPKSANQGTSTCEEEPIPALTITIKREKPINGASTENGDVLKPKITMKIKKELRDESDDGDKSSTAVAETYSINKESKEESDEDKSSQTGKGTYETKKDRASEESPSEEQRDEEEIDNEEEEGESENDQNDCNSAPVVNGDASSSSSESDQNESVGADGGDS